jgi:predicted metal-dependent HD superfamily phosphohydrolase
MDSIVKKSSEYVIKLLNEQLSPQFTYHNLAHTRDVFEAVIELGVNSNLPADDFELIQIAAWFHDTGFTKGYIDHEHNSAVIAETFLVTTGYDNDKISRIKETILMTEKGNSPVSVTDKIIRDADILHIGKEDFYSRSLTLKAEWETVDNKQYTEMEWIQSSLDFINRTFFYSDYAKSKYEAGRQKNITFLNELIREKR